MFCNVSVSLLGIPQPLIRQPWVFQKLLICWDFLTTISEVYRKWSEKWIWCRSAPKLHSIWGPPDGDNYDCKKTSGPVNVCGKTALWLDLCKPFPADPMSLVTHFESYWIQWISFANLGHVIILSCSYVAYTQQDMWTSLHETLHKHCLYGIDEYFIQITQLYIYLYICYFNIAPNGMSD